MKVLIACEASQKACKAFRERGHEAFSSDIIECYGDRPEWHIQGDVIDVLNRYPDKHWDLIIIHIPCTKVAVSGNRWYGKGTVGYMERVEAIEWSDKVWEMVKTKAKKCALENPVSVLFSELKFEDVFYIQPHQFGHGETKKTGFGVVGLPRLKPTKNVSGREQRIWKMPPSADRAKLRSETYQGVADAIAEQWSI